MAKFTTGHMNTLAEFFKDLHITNALPEQHQGKLYFPAVHYFVMMDTFCDLMKSTNPTFDRKRFLKAADCPYFDEVRMGVPVIIDHCIDCGLEVINIAGEKRELMCTKHLRLQYADLTDQ